MADVSTPHLPTSFSDLDYDILLLIFEQVNLLDQAQGIKDLSKSNPNEQWFVTFHPEERTLAPRRQPESLRLTYWHTIKTLPILRLVSKSLERLVTPIRYRSFQPKLSDLNSPFAAKVVSNVVKYTKDIIVHDNVDWELIATTYQSFPSLKTIKWIFTPQRRGAMEDLDLEPIPSDILRPYVRILIDTTCHFEAIMSIIPPEHVTYLNLGYWQLQTLPDASFDATRKLKSYLLLATNLKCFTHNDSFGSVPRLSDYCMEPFQPFSPSESMPAFRELSLSGYDWNHSPVEVESSWNFRELEFLDIRGVPLVDFLTAVEFKHFAKLRVLKVGDFVWHTEEPMTSVGTFMLEEFLRFLPSLEDLHIDGRLDTLNLRSLQSLSKLKFLTLRRCVLFDGMQEMIAGVGQDGLEKLRKWCPMLRRLSIDVDAASLNFPTYLRILSSFPRLEKITLFMNAKYFHPPGSRFNTTYAILEEASNNTLSSLFRNITIEVGGWHSPKSHTLGALGNKMWVSERVFKWRMKILH